MGEQKPADPGKGALDEVGMSQALLSSLISVSARGRGGVHLLLNFGTLLVYLDCSNRLIFPSSLICFPHLGCFLFSICNEKKGEKKEKRKKNNAKG